MRQGRNKRYSVGGIRWLTKEYSLSMMSCSIVILLLGGCNVKPTELRGKTSFGPEFRNRGNNTQEVRYDARQAFDLKWDNGWSTGIQYRRRDVDDGSGDNENRVLVEVGYPLWKAPKKEEKSTERRIEDLQKQVEEMRARVAALRMLGTVEESRVAHASDAGR